MRGRQKGISDALVFEKPSQSHHVRFGRELHQFPPLETPPAFRAALPLLDGSPADARSAAGTAAAAASGVHDVQPDFTAAARGGGIVHGMVSVSVRARVPREFIYIWGGSQMTSVCLAILSQP